MKLLPKVKKEDIPSTGRGAPLDFTEVWDAFARTTSGHATVVELKNYSRAHKLQKVARKKYLLDQLEEVTKKKNKDGTYTVYLLRA